MTDAGNRSGGADLSGQTVTVGADVVGRDKLVQPTTYNYYGTSSAQLRRAELPHQPYFFGREEELAIIAEALEPESNGWGVLIDGPGGIGKTALAIRAGHLAPDNLYPTKIFLSAKARELTPQGEQKLEDFMLPNYMTLLAELARELGDEGIERIDPNERPKEVRRLLEKRYALIIIDNLETFTEKERERLFQFLKRLPRSCKALVTSRCRTDVAAEVIRLDRLSPEAAHKLIAKLAERNKHLDIATREERQGLYEIAGGNPLLIEWIAGQLGRAESRCRTIADACTYLERVPKDNDPLEYIFGDLIDTLTPHETNVLAALAHFTLPAKTNWIAEIGEVSSIAAETALEDLSERALIKSATEAQTYILSPLIAHFLRQTRPETVLQTGKRLIDRVYVLALENGFDNYERFLVLETQWPVLAASLPLFLEGDNSRLQRLCDALYSFMNFYGHWDERLHLSLAAEEHAVASNDWQCAGWRANDAGRIYVRRGQVSETFDCVDRAEAYWSKITIGPRERGTVSRLRGWAYELQQDYPAAIEAYQEALSVWRALAPESLEVSKALTAIAEVQRLLGNLVLAEQGYREALRIDMKLDNTEGIATCKGYLAELALVRHDLLSSETLAGEALELSDLMGRQELIARVSMYLAMSLIQQGRGPEALPHAQKAVEIFTRLRSRRLVQAQSILKECSG